MSNKITFNEYEISKTQIGANKFHLSVFKAGKFDFQFEVSLQPTGNDSELPTYQLVDKAAQIPEWAKKNIPTISEWIIKDKK